MLAPTHKSTKTAVTLQKKHGVSFALGVALFALVFAFAYSFAVDQLHRKAEFAESNFQANLLRLGEFLHGSNPSGAVLVGSSMSARLLPSFFQDLHPSNLALDGSSGRTGLRFLIDSKRPLRVVLIEENTITRPSGDNEALLIEATREPQMRAAGWLPFLRAAYRPSSIVYSALKKWTDQTRGAPAAALNPSVAAPVNISTADRESVERNLRRAVEMIHILREKGTQVLIYRLPMGQRQPGPNALHQALPEVPFVDVEAELKTLGHVPCYSDGMHLVAPSARFAAQVLKNALAKSGLLSRTNPPTSSGL